MTDLEREVIAAACAYITWEDDAWDANAQFDQERSKEALQRVSESDAAYGGFVERLRQAVYALEDAGLVPEINAACGNKSAPAPAATSTRDSNSTPDFIARPCLDVAQR